MNAHPLAEQRRQLPAEVRAAVALFLHQQGLAGATAQRLGAQRAGPGEQVQHPGAGQFRLQPVEQGFAHAIRGRAQVTALVDEMQPVTAPFATDDTHLPLAGFASCLHYRSVCGARGPMLTMARRSASSARWNAARISSTVTASTRWLKRCR